MNIASTPGVAAVVSDKLCAVYDEETGEVIHFHRVTTLDGGDAPDDDQIQARALEHADALDYARGGSQGGTIKAALVDLHDFQPGRVHKVDLQTRKLVAHEAHPNS